ncbi:histidine kinase [Ramlibacter sp. GCM10027632]
MPPGSPAPLQLLVVEDAEFDFALLVATLQAQGWPCEARRVDTEAALAGALAERPWDLVISDHCLPGFSSAQAWDAVSALPARPPFIIVSGMLGEDAAVAAMQRGVDDYLVKGRLARLGTAVRNALAAGAARREQALARQREDDYRRRLQALSAQLQDGIDAERTRFAREVHDDIGGTLTAVRFDLEAALREAGPGAAPRIARALAELSQIQQAAQRIVRDLRPPILDAGLAAALQWHSAHWADRHGAAMRFDCAAPLPDLPPALAMCLYRACQEALTNIAKHAGATQVSVDLHAGDGLLSLEIEDNGRGFDASCPGKPGSFGLQGLRERMRAVGGQLDVRSVPGRTTLLLWVPLDAHAGACDLPDDLVTP